MSRVIEQIASVQFQVNARQANAAMLALQQAAKDLTKYMNDVNKKIADLGNVSPDNKQLLEYQQQLRGIKKDYDDVMKAQRDFVKGAKAADQLWKAAQDQNIETLSVRSIKAGVSGLRKRQENLAADKSDPNNMREFRIIQQVIEESERVMKDFRSDVDNTIQTIRDGGTVSVQSMRNALKAAEELRDSVEEGTGEWRDYQQQVEFMTKSLDDYSAAQRRIKGEIVDSNDARREAVKLTEDGERAAAKEREMADAIIASTRQQINDYQQLRKFQQERIDKTEEEMSTNLRLQEAEHARLAEMNKDMRSLEAEDRRSAKTYRGRSETASSSADWLDAIARNRENEANQALERVQNTQAEVNAIKSRIEVLNQSASATKKNSKAYKELQELQGQLKDKTKELNKQTKDYEEALDHANKAQQRANEKQAEAVQLRAKAENYEDKAAHAEENREKVLDREAKKIRELYMQYDQLDDRLKKERAEQAATDRAMVDVGNQQAAAEGRKAQAQVATVKSISNAIKILEEQNEVIDQNSKEWKENTAIIQRLQERLNEMKVAPALQMMTERMGRVPQLSATALQETKKFWEGMVAGAEKGSTELKIYEGNLKVIAEEERLRNKELKNKEYRKDAKSLFGDLSRKSTEEINNAITAGKKLLDTYKAGSPAAEKLARAILDAEEYVKQYGVEAERTARKEETLRQKMTDRISNLKNLSDEGLVETKKYWQEQMKGAERTSAAYKEAEANIKAINDRQKDLANIQQRQTARQVLRRDLTTMSEGELRAAINAAKEYMQQFSIGGKVREKYNEAILRGEKLLKEYSAETMKAKQQEEALRQTMEGRMGKLSSLSAEALEETKKYWTEQMKSAERGTQAYRDFEARIKAINEEQKQLHQSQIQRTARSIFGNQEMMSEEQLRNAINAAKEYVQQFKVGGDVRRMYNDAIARGEELLKRYSVETEKAIQKEREQNQLMVARLSTLNTLSTEGLSETKKYWQAQMDGADRASQAFKDAEDAMRRITEQERIRQNAQAMKVIGNMGAYSDAEINDAIKAFEQLRDAQAHGSAEWKMYNKHVQEGKKYLEEWAQVDSVIKYEGQMSNLTTLSDAALQETKKFWETMVAGAEKGSSELKQYEAQLERVTQEERERNQMANEMKAQKLGGRYADMSEQEIREAIEAGTQLIKTYDSGSQEAKVLSERIVRASEYLKQHGTEALRVAQQETEAIRKRKEADQLMTDQLHQGKQLSQSALKAQEQYWQRLIDDPKTAASSLDVYRQNLEKVKMLQDLMSQENVTLRGEETLERLRGDVDYESKISENQRKEDVAALKAYRDALPKEGNASVLKEIDYYLKQLGETAKESGQEIMSINDALAIASKAGTKGFVATPQEIQSATKALEKQRDIIINTIKAKRESGAATDAEEKELADLTKKLRDLKFEQDNFNMSQAKMQELMRTPTNAVSLDELRSAIKRADAELHRMEGSLGENSREYQNFATQVKNAKNTLKEMEGAAKASATAWEKAWSRLKTYVGLYMGFNIVWQKLSGSVGDLMELSDKMGEVRKTTGFAADEVGHLSDNLKKLDTRTTITGLLDLSVAAGQLGLKTQEDVQGFTEAANKLMVALPEMGKEGATEMLKVALATGEIAKIEKQMQEGLIEGSSATAVAMEKVGSTIDRLRATSAATAPAITDFVKRVGAVGAQSGISIDQVAALGSTVDALGMRVEMSATALSRMIPAIKNNAFAVSKAIGVTPETLRSLFEAGRGMEAILMIFQHIKDANMDSDSIESMLGMGNMKEIMKELNQMGARAGIVFSGLSQNVDELRRQLNVAGDAYKQNIAIQQEYEKMNETTAAKWERLKNQVEEMFVGDETQSLLGHIIDGLRTIVDLLAGPLSGAFKGALAGLGSYSLGLGGLLEKVKDFATGEEDASEKIKEWWDKLEEGNVWDIVVSGTIAAGFALYDYLDSLKEAAREVARFNEELVNEQNKVEDLTKSITAANANVEDAEKEVAKAREEVEKAKKALDEAKKSTDDTKEATDKLAEAESKLIVEEEKKRNSMAEQKKLVEQFNSLYSKYLGFMISEISSTNELNKARDLLNTKLRETITLKRKEAALNRLEESEGEGRDAAYSELSLALGSAFRKQVVVGHDKNKKEIKAWTEDRERNAALLRQVTELAQSEKLTAKQVEEALAKAGLSIYETGRNGEKRINAFGANIRNLIMNYSKEYKSVQKKVDDVMVQFDVEASLDRKESQEKLSEQYKASASRYGELEKEYANATGKAKKQAAANLLKQADTLEEMITAAPNYYDLNNESEKASYEKFVKDTQARIDGIKDQREALIKEAGNAYQARKTVSGDMTTGGGGENPWGSRLPAESTAYADMSADVLVNRRKQMKEFVNAIQTDTDVQSVLKEDAALKKAIENGMASDMRTVIEWYNTERLKIQDELNARHLTNTGDWKDPKQEKARKKRLQDDMKAYLEELDAYYTERKAKIQEARNDEEISEAEAWNRNIRNEAEWHRRRAELQKLYADKGVEVTQEEQDAIYNIIAERTEDDVNFIKATIGKTVQFSKAIRDANEQGAKEYRKFQGDLQLGWEKDFLKQRQALGKHLEAIEDIVNKERPFSGIVKTMQDNLGKMGILTADLGDDAESAADELKRLTFLMEEAESAYTMTVDKLLEDMRQHGFREWADVISKDPSMQQGMLAMLRMTFDSVQDAIKKESSIIKKQVEIMFEDINDQAQADDTRLQILQNSVSRANSLIGAGAASERVADKLAIKQIQLQITIQETRLRMLQKAGNDRIALLNHEADLLDKQNKTEEARQKRMDAENVKKALGLTLTKDQKELDKQRVALAEKLEESQNRLYTQLKEWSTLLASSLQGVMEATHAGDSEYYNELAKLNLTGKGGPGAGTYIVIDNEGTSDAKAHYEYLDERQALERQREIERENAQADAWKKVMDDLNMKMSEQITDWINASMQNASIDANTDATLQNTTAIVGLTEQMQAQGNTPDMTSNGLGGLSDISSGNGTSSNNGTGALNPAMQGLTTDQVAEWTDALGDNPMLFWAEQSDAATKKMKDNNDKITKSTKSSFAAMTAAANMYGIAYQTMANDNLSTTQKVEMMIVQAAGQAAISMLTASMAAATGDTAANAPRWISKTLAELGPIGGPVAVGVFTALIGGLMGMAASKISKSKSQIAQVTGSSINAGRLATGMQTYAEGNVNEFTDPDTLTPGRHYNVDGADGKTYRAKYTGKGAKTHMTSGPEFHLVGEAGQEAIIDAHTTRNIRLNEPEIWRSIQTLYNGGRLSATRRRGRGVRAYADGNLEDFEMSDGGGMMSDGGMGGFTPEMAAQMQASLDRNSEVLERALTEGIKGVFNVYGSDGLVHTYDSAKKTLNRHGERY